MHPFQALILSSSLLSAGAFAQEEANNPPVVHTGGNSGVDYRVDCNNVFLPTSAVTSVQLDGSGSYDPDGTPVTFFWHNECAAGSFDDPTSPTPVYHVDMTSTCARECWIALRVTSAGQTSVKGFRVIVEDATAPQLLAPRDVVGIWGDSILTADTGVATATDNCDPAPVVTYVDVELPHTGPGQPELMLQRTWTVTDCTGRQASSVQSIFLLAPTGAIGARANLDFDPGQCPNQFSIGPTGTIDMLLLGSTKFRADQVVKSSVRLALRSEPGVQLAPISFLLKDLGSITAQSYGECNSVALDGMKDLRLRFDRVQLANVLGLGALAPGQSIDLMLTGRLTTGKLWGVRDTITLQ